MRYLRLIGLFIRAAAQQELAYRTNFVIGLLHSLLSLGTGILGLVIVFGQVETVRGWTFPATLALLGVYLIVGALRGLCIGPSLDKLAGLGGEVWTGSFDWTLLRPVNAQFLASFRYWRLWALIDFIFGVSVLGVALAQLNAALTPVRIVMFLLALGASVMTLYALLLAFAALAFWSPGVLTTWVFDGVFQMARYPITLYPGWLRLVLTWIVPVGIMTTVPAQALSGDLSWAWLLGSAVMAAVMLVGSSVLFRRGARRYASASS